MPSKSRLAVLTIVFKSGYKTVWNFETTDTAEEITNKVFAHETYLFNGDDDNCLFLKTEDVSCFDVCIS